MCFTKYILPFARRGILGTMEDQKDQTTNTPVMHSFIETKTSPQGKFLVYIVLIAFVGVGTGFVLAKFSVKTGAKISLLPKSSSAIKGKTYGSKDTETFKDTTEGVLKEGGVEGEGQYHLVRPGGDSQNVYLTSSLVDLSQFMDRKIKVWGETQKAQKAGWLMDAGRVEVID